MENSELSIAHQISPLWATNVFDLMFWTNDYRKRNRFPVPILKRFAIGLYQINQGMEWKDQGVNKNEGFAAAVLHFMMVSQELDLMIEQHLEIKLDDFGKTSLNTESILFHVSRAQQQLFYADQGNRTKRVSRYNKDKLTESLGIAIRCFIEAIPVEFRSDCFEKATTIMTRELK